jgi:hypothetical protein
MSLLQGSEETNRLYHMFVSGELKMEAQPRDIMDDFPTILWYPTDKIRSWFNRVRKKAKGLIDDEDNNQQGKRGKSGELLIYPFFPIWFVPSC